MQSALIIGGGPAGATAATLLARAGQTVTLIERAPGPVDKVCGDFLSGEAVSLARSLGVEPLSLGAQPVSRLRLICGTRTAETELPFAALSLSRRRFDEALLCGAETACARVLRGHAVTGIEQTGTDIGVRTQDLGILTADRVFLATGKHDLRGMPRGARSDPGRRPIGLKMYYRLTPTEADALSGHVELMLFPGGYAGLQAVEDGQAVLCLLTAPSRDLAGPAGWAQLCERLTIACPHLRQRLDGAQPLGDRPHAIAGLPYGFLHRHRATDHPALYRLGDQAAVIPSLTGDGVAIAMHSATLATQSVMQGQNAGQFAAHLHRTLARQMRIAGVVHKAGTAPGLGHLVVWAGRTWPWVMRWVAAMTRVSGGG